MLNNVILNDKGKIVYYNLDGLEKKTILKIKQDDQPVNINSSGNRLSLREKWGTVSENQLNAADKCILAFTSKNVYTPAATNGYVVPYRLLGDEWPYVFSVKGGNVVFQ